LQLPGQVLQHVPDGPGVQLVEVVHGVARLVGGLGAGDAQLVGLPDEVDVLRQPPVDAVPGGGGAAARLVEQLGDVAQLGEDGAAGGRGGVGGEDGPDAEVGDGLPQVVGV